MPPRWLDDRDRFGKWQQLLGSENVWLSYTVDTPSHGMGWRFRLTWERLARIGIGGALLSMARL
jgi:hypothetical protein